MLLSLARHLQLGFGQTAKRGPYLIVFPGPTHTLPDTWSSLCGGLGVHLAPNLRPFASSSKRQPSTRGAQKRQPPPTSAANTLPKGWLSISVAPAWGPFAGCQARRQAGQPATRWPACSLASFNSIPVPFRVARSLGNKAPSLRLAIGSLRRASLALSARWLLRILLYGTTLLSGALCSLSVAFWVPFLVPFRLPFRLPFCRPTWPQTITRSAVSIQWPRANKITTQLQRATIEKWKIPARSPPNKRQMSAVCAWKMVENVQKWCKMCNQNLENLPSTVCSSTSSSRKSNNWKSANAERLASGRVPVGSLRATLRAGRRLVSGGQSRRNWTAKSGETSAMFARVT